MTVEIQPQRRQRRDGSVVRRCSVSGLDRGKKPSTDLWFRLPSTIPLPDDNDCDAYVLSVLMDAMQVGRDLRIHGTVSRQLLSNLIEFQHAWHRWRPRVFDVVEIEVDEISDDISRGKGAVCAFSGGVDATFTVWRHSRANYGYRNQKIGCCAFVHGFDIPLDKTREFDNLFRASSTTLKPLGLELLPIATNYRQFSNVNWEYASGAALVGALTNLKPIADVCLVGSGEPYDALVIPWGSSPLTDHLLGSDAFVVVHDGASHSRVEKIEAIADWQEGVSGLQVCWEGGFFDRNCGKCEKCVRTKLNFLAAQKPIPPCLSGGDLIHDIESVRIGSQPAMEEWQLIYRTAKEKGVTDPWVEAVARVLKKKNHLKAVANMLFPEGTSRRVWLRSARRLTKLLPTSK